MGFGSWFKESIWKPGEGLKGIEDFSNLLFPQTAREVAFDRPDKMTEALSL